MVIYLNKAKTLEDVFYFTDEVDEVHIFGRNVEVLTGIWPVNLMIKTNDMSLIKEMYENTFFDVNFKKDVKSFYQGEFKPYGENYIFRIIARDVPYDFWEQYKGLKRNKYFCDTFQGL